VPSAEEFGSDPLCCSGTQSKCFSAHYREPEFGSQGESFLRRYLSEQCLQPIWCNVLLKAVENKAFIGVLRKNGPNSQRSERGLSQPPDNRLPRSTRRNGCFRACGSFAVGPASLKAMVRGQPTHPNTVPALLGPTCPVLVQLHWPRDHLSRVVPFDFIALSSTRCTMLDAFDRSILEALACVWPRWQAS